MSKGRKNFARLAALTMLAFGAAPALAGTVVASSGPSAAQFRVGSQVSDTQRITLRDGDMLTVLTSGGTRVLRGPGTFVVSQQGASTSNRALAALTSQRSATRARGAAVRGPEGGQPVTNPILWYVDVNAAQTLKVCLPADYNVRFWRAEYAAAATYTLTMGSMPETATPLNFGEGEMLTGWAGGAAPQAGQSYTIVPAAGGTPTEVSFAFLEEVSADPEVLAQALIANGCTEQLDRLASALVVE